MSKTPGPSNSAARTVARRAHRARAASRPAPELPRLATVTELARHYGVTYATIRTWIRRHGVEPVRWGMREYNVFDKGGSSYQRARLYDSAAFARVYRRTRVSTRRDPVNHPGELYCSHCDRWLPPAEFSRGGRGNYCLPCSRAYNVEYKRRNADKVQHWYREHEERKKGRAYVPGWRPPGDTAPGAA